MAVTLPTQPNRTGAGTVGATACISSLERDRPPVSGSILETHLRIAARNDCHPANEAEIRDAKLIERGVVDVERRA